MEENKIDDNKVEISVSGVHDGIVEIKTEKIDKRMIGEWEPCDNPPYVPLTCKKRVNKEKIKEIKDACLKNNRWQYFDLEWFDQSFVEVKPKNSFRKWLNNLKNKFRIKKRTKLHPNLKRVKDLMYRIEYMKTIVPLQKELERLKFEYERPDLKKRIENLENRIASLNKLKE